MKVIAHRGIWNSEEEKNTLMSFEEAFKIGIGIETDVRDYNGNLVISHDIANENSILFEDVLKLSRNYNDPILAINIKADGLQNELKKLLEIYNVKNYFVFDMSIPEQIVFNRNSFEVFSRQSEFEKEPLLYDECSGIWFDLFYEDSLLKEDVILSHIMNNKKIVFVSPELHKRETEEVWKFYKFIDEKYSYDQLYVCTDFSIKAIKYFEK